MEDSYLPEDMDESSLATDEYVDHSLFERSASQHDHAASSGNFHEDSVNSDHNENVEARAKLPGKGAFGRQHKHEFTHPRQVYGHQGHPQNEYLPFHEYGNFPQPYPAHATYNFGLPSYASRPSLYAPGYGYKGFGYRRPSAYSGYGAAGYGPYGVPRYSTVRYGSAYRYPAYGGLVIVPLLSFHWYR